MGGPSRRISRVKYSMGTLPPNRDMVATSESVRLPVFNAGRRLDPGGLAAITMANRRAKRKVPPQHQAIFLPDSGERASGDGCNPCPMASGLEPGYSGGPHPRPPSRRNLIIMTPHERARRLRGIVLLVLSSSIFAGVDGISKLLADTQSVGQIVWARYALALPVLILTTRPADWAGLFRTARPG